MSAAEGEWMFWAAIGIALFVCLYAAAFGEPDDPVDLPSSSMDL